MQLDVPKLSDESRWALCVALPLPEFPDGGVWTVCNSRLLRKLAEFHRLMTTGPVGRLSSWAWYCEFHFADNLLQVADVRRDDWFLAEIRDLPPQESEAVYSANFSGDALLLANFSCRMVSGESYADFPQLDVQRLYADVSNRSPAESKS